jgi:ParB family transcriptional regulator, chromosome partitioning protein
MASTLGRGLGSLLGEEAVMEIAKEKVREVSLEQIIPNRNQPRMLMEPESLNELADSIREQGVLQPILVRQFGDKNGEKPRYELVAGERRWRASKLAGLTKIPILVRDWDDDQSLEVAILENIQREELNPIETARGYENLIRNFGYSHKKVGRRVGKSRVAVSNALRLLNLPAEVVEMVSVGALTMGHARALLAMDQGPAMIIHLAKKVVEEGLSVRATETVIRQMAEKKPMEEEIKTEEPMVLTGKGRGGRRRDPMIIEVEKRLQTELNTAVAITCVKGRGKIILEFENPEMLEALTELLLI